MNTLRTGKAAGLAAVLGGFAISFHAAPANAASATLIFDTSGGTPATAAVYDAAESCRGMKQVDNLDSTHQDRKVSIPGGRPVSFGMASIASGAEQCTKLLTFTPVDGHRYLATYMQQAPGKCSVLLADITHSSHISQISPTQRTFTPSFTKDGPSCK